MIQIILLIAGIVTAARLPALKRRTAADYPNADPEKFRTWHEADLKSAYVFLIASLGTFVIQIAVMVVTGLAAGVSQNVNILYVGYAISGVVFFGALVWAAILGSRASKLKNEAGIA